MWKTIFLKDEIGEIVGELDYDDNSITTIIIYPLYRYKGYGRRLLQIGVEKVENNVVQIMSTKKNLVFYDKCGFTRCIGSDEEKHLGIRDGSTHYIVKS